MADPLAFAVAIDPSQVRGPVNPLLFGHNLEHTRSCIWQGLSAQLLRNRKFCGKPSAHGVALDWYEIPAPHAYFELSRHSYTEHVDPTVRRHNELSSQRLALGAAGETAGIGQSGLPLHAGWSYEGRVVLDAPAPVTLHLRLLADDGGLLVEQTLQVGSNQWRTHEFIFTPARTCLDARLELSLEEMGEIYVGAASLLPSDHFHGMRPDVVALLREIGCTLLRWPGGNFAGDYRWQDGLLPVDKRGPLAAFTEMETLPHTRGFDGHEIGTDEFIALCRAIGAEPFVTVNITWDTPEIAAAWVEYCNGSLDTEWGRKRAKRGHPVPYAVKHWSLGNEQGYGHMEGPNTPETYAAKAAACAEAMLRVDPSLNLCTSGRWSDPAWLTDGIRLVAPSVDHLSHHHYTWHPQEVLGEGALAEFRRIVLHPEVVFAEMREIRAAIEAGAGGKPIGLSLDEWNVWYAWYRHPGVTEGIHNAALLNRLCRDAEQLGISYACFFEPVNEGAILVEPFGAYLPAGGQVFPLLKAHLGNALLQLPPQKGDADVDLTASFHTETGIIVVTLVNRHPTEERSVFLSFGGASPQTLDGTLLSAPDFLPGTDFTASPLSVTHRDDSLALHLPKHSVALLRGTLRGNERNDGGAPCMPL
jgi:alpha-N-arabinofuranosidase